MSTGPDAGEADSVLGRASSLAPDGPENYPIAPMMALLCLVCTTEGLDNGLFPAITKALENTIQFDVGILGLMAMVQFFCEALAGPFWGVLASRAIMTRPQILTLGVLLQGLATFIMWMFIENFAVLLILRGVTGFCLASLRPIANSIVADRFDNETRGKYFGYIHLFHTAGAGFSQLFGTLIGEMVFFPSLPTFWGWKLAFVLIGGFTMSLAPAIHFCLRAPLVRVDPNKDKNVGVGQEIQTIRKLLQIPTFAIIVLQGCVGKLPWRALGFRIFFYQTAGLSNADAANVAILGGSSSLFGAVAGGYIGDCLNKTWPMHGRVLCAELSVYGCIPIAYMTFFVFPEADAAFWWYFSLTFALGLISGWTTSGCNPAVLCTIVAEDERSLVLTWNAALQGAVGALGPLIFTWLLTNVFDYNLECNEEQNQNRPDCQNLEAAGTALGYTTCIPWLICGLLYSSLHYFYPRDLAAIEKGQQQTELTEFSNSNQS